MVCERSAPLPLPVVKWSGRKGTFYFPTLELGRPDGAVKYKIAARSGGRGMRVSYYVVLVVWFNLGVGGQMLTVDHLVGSDSQGTHQDSS